jgi:dipeptidyl aminopeptidase/acylaminoacyl peptidase
MSGHTYRFRACFALLALTALVASAQQKRMIRDTDIYQFHWLADPQISPDGNEVVYTQVNVNAKHTGYESALWLVATAGGVPRQLTAGPGDTTPRWSPDGKRIAFVRRIEKDGKPQPPQIFVLPMDGGEARQLTAIPKGVGGPVWSPDGRSIAFNSTAKPEDFDKDAAKEEAEKSDVRIITRAVYRMNGVGYLDPDRPPHIWTVRVPEIVATPEKARRVTSGEFAESDINWSPDGSAIYYLSDRDLEPYYKPRQNALYRVELASGKTDKITAIDGAIHGVSFNPAGNHVAFIGEVNGHPIRSYSQPDLWIASPEPGATPKNLTADYDFEIGGDVGGDQEPPRGGRSEKIFWSKDGRYIYVDSAEEGRSNLKRIDAETGKMQPLTDSNFVIYSYSATPDGSKAALAISTPVNIGDLFVLDTATGNLKQLTHINRQLFSQLNLTEPVMIWYKSFDGRKIQTWVQRPPNFDPSKKYPLILDIHGGPHWAYGYVFDHEFQWMAAKGYIVLYPNPRGSTTYGQEFGNVIQYHYPGDDFKDLMAGIDDLIARGWVDANRLGVTGGSGGGVLTNWAVGHTQRFKAAVSQRSIADWADFWYDADFALFQPTWFRGAPWEDPADFKARSPITYIDKVTTPMMFIEGEADMRCPPASGGEQMFRALKYRHIPAVMVRFPGETHELSRSGKPTHRVARLDNIVAWMDKWVDGKDIHTYDVQ